MQGWGHDFRIAARRLLATPVFTLFAVSSLAFGLGVTTIAYSMVDAMFFKTLGIREPGRLAFLLAPGSGRIRNYKVISRPDFDDLRASVRSFDGLAASRTFSMSVVSPSTTELVQTETVNGRYFPTLGVPAALGRTISPEDDDRAAAVAVLGYDLWRTRFASNPGIIGQTVRIGDFPFEVIGVAPRSFAGIATDFFFAGSGTRLWVPLSAAARFAPATRWFASTDRAATAPTPEREQRELTLIGRLRAGVAIENASAELSRLGAALDLSYPITVPFTATRAISHRGWTARTVSDVSAEATAGLRRVGTVVAGLVWLVLVVACTNLANLVLARGTTRRREFAIRRALGAGRWRLVREQTCESVLIAFAGGSAAWMLMRAFVGGFRIDLPVSRSSIMSLQPVIDSGMLLMAAGALLVSVVVFGLEPAIQLTRSWTVSRDLAEGAAGLGPARAKRQRLLLRWQVAISTGFFILASLSIRYVIAEMRHDSGVQIDRLAIASLNFAAQGWDETRARRAIDRIVIEAAKQPDIQSVAVSTGLPLGTFVPLVQVSTPDRPITAKGTFVTAALVASTPGIQRTLGVPLLRGRPFDDRDGSGARTVVVVSETAAHELFGSSEVVGRDLMMQATRRGGKKLSEIATIIGVARDTDTSYFSSSRSGVVYAPLAQHFDPFITITARASRNTSAAIGALRTAIRHGDSDVAIESIADGRAMLSGPFVLLRFLGVTSVSLGLLTLSLAMAGLYGVQSQGVADRTREIGVRMSFGATAAQIKRMVLKDGYRPVLEGISVGVFIGLSGRAIIRAYLDANIGIVDPWMLVIVPIPLILAAFCACYLPARRASSVDPTVALRHL